MHPTAKNKAMVLVGTNCKRCICKVPQDFLASHVHHGDPIRFHYHWGQPTPHRNTVLNCIDVVFRKCSFGGCCAEAPISQSAATELPHASSPWREADFRTAGTLINMAEKRRECETLYGSNTALVNLFGGVLRGNASSKTAPLLHSGLAAIVAAAWIQPRTNYRHKNTNGSKLWDENKNGKPRPENATGGTKAGCKIIDLQHLTASSCMRWSTGCHNPGLSTSENCRWTTMVSYLLNVYSS